MPIWTVLPKRCYTLIEHTRTPSKPFGPPFKRAGASDKGRFNQVRILLCQLQSHETPCRKPLGPTTRACSCWGCAQIKSPTCSAGLGSSNGRDDEDCEWPGRSTTNRWWSVKNGITFAYSKCFEKSPCRNRMVCFPVGLRDRWKRPAWVAITLECSLGSPNAGDRGVSVTARR